MGNLTLQRMSLWRLILIPGLISLAVTLLRLVGELGHWSKTFFNPAPGGPWSIVGITWLAPLFGIYFALKLSAGGEGPKSFVKAVGFALLGAALVFVLSIVGSKLQMDWSFRGRLLYLWAAFALAALVTLPGWPALFKVMTGYAYAARIPVVVVMLLAFRGNWGTHYDALPQEFSSGAGLWGKFLWLGFFPQLIFWVGFTVVSGMLFGSLVAGLMRFARRGLQPAS
jgi:hypothetical protein